MLTLDSVLGIATSIAPSLRGQDLVVVRAQVQTDLLPLRKVAGHVDGAAVRPLVVDAVRDVLPEGRLARDGRLVDLLVLPDLVRAAVELVAAELLALRRPGAARGPLLDVVLDQGAARPAVDGDYDGTRGSGGASGEGDVPVETVC